MKAASSVIVLACLLAWSAPAALGQEPTTAPQAGAGQQAPADPLAGAGQAPTTGPQYVGAEACKSCHEAIFASWSQTKHARAIGRLSKEDKEGGKCIRCHVTGSPELIEKEGATPTHPNVQCESCHGPGSLHAADATVRTGIRKEPGAAACEGCHNASSPKFRGFVYGGMKGFSHPVKK